MQRNFFFGILSAAVVVFLILACLLVSAQAFQKGVEFFKKTWAVLWASIEANHLGPCFVVSVGVFVGGVTGGVLSHFTNNVLLVVVLIVVAVGGTIRYLHRILL